MKRSGPNCAVTGAATHSPAAGSAVLFLVEDEDVVHVYTDDQDGRAAAEADLAWMRGGSPLARFTLRRVVPRSSPVYLGRVVLPNPPSPSHLAPLPVGWVELVRTALWDDLPFIAPGFRVHSVGEQFGAAQIQLDPASIPAEKQDDVGVYVEALALASKTVCGSCGAAGAPIEGSPRRTRCEAHREDEGIHAVVDWPGRDLTRSRVGAPRGEGSP